MFTFNNHHVSNTLTIFSFFLMLLILILPQNLAAFSTSENMFYIKKKNDPDFIECNRVILEPEGLKCMQSHLRTIRLFKVDLVEFVKYNGKKVYPYDRSTRLTEKDLINPDCEYIEKAIRGPLALEQNQQIYVLVGTMFEKGICVKQNHDRAISFYRKAGSYGEEKYYSLMKKLRPKKEFRPANKPKPVDPEFVQNLQRDSDMKRIQEESMYKACSKTCELHGTSTQYRISEKCYFDCMADAGFPNTNMIPNNMEDY